MIHIKFTNVNSPRREKMRKALTDKCIVLDLDETLISTQDNMEDIARLGILADPDMLEVRERFYILNLLDATGKRGEGQKEQMWGLERPGLQDFIEFCFGYFSKVIVWTAAYERYAIQLCKHIFRNSEYWPDLIWTREDCEMKDKIRYKPLKKMIKGMPGMTLENTFALDNNIDTFLDNPRNALHIPDYDPKLFVSDKVLTKDALKRGDDRLIEVQDWLLKNKVINSKDVQTLDKTNVFTPEPLEDIEMDTQEEPYFTHDQKDMPMDIEAQA